MDEKMYSKQEVIQHVWSYSRFYSQQLFQCEEFFKDGKGYAAITILFTVLENIIKLAANDYDSSFYDVSKELADKSIITDEEYKFISTNQFSIRKIRNLFAHANLFAVNIVNIEDDREILYPFTEEESCLLLYSKVSDIIFNIILKIASRNLILNINVNLSKVLHEFTLEIRILTPNEIATIKGFPENSLDNTDIPYNEKLKIFDEASDVNIYEQIFKKIFDKQND